MASSESTLQNDKNWMAYAIQLARRGRFTVDPNPAVGSVLVRNDRVLGEGFHLFAGGGHAEKNCFEQVRLNQVDLNEVKQATLYVTLEPCCHHGRTPPCTDVIIAQGVRRVVIGQMDSNRCNWWTEKLVLC